MGKYPPKKKNRLLAFTGKVGNLALDQIKLVDEQLPLVKASGIFVNPLVNYLVVMKKEVPIGIVSRKSVFTEKLNVDDNKSLPVGKVMDEQLITVQKDAAVFDTLMYMIKNQVEYMLVLSDKKPVGVITQEDWISSQVNYPLLLIRNIESAESVNRLSYLRKQSNKVILKNFKTEENIVSLTEITTVINDAFVKRAIQLSLEKMQKEGDGLPPVPFSWIGMGSEGRKAQTVRTDQDNGIIFSDPPKGSYDEVKSWFLKFAGFVVEALQVCGFPKCPGNIMATNPELCNSLEHWQKHFEEIIKNADSKRLLEASIYFDFRSIYGNSTLTDNLWDYLFDRIDNQTFFMRFFAENIIQASRPPVKKWQWKLLKFFKVKLPVIDIKREAIAPLDAAVRLLALECRIRETNTLERLDQIMEKGMMPKVMADRVHVAFDFLLRLRFRLEFKYDTKAKTEHEIDPNKLMPMEVRELKDSLKTVYELQNYVFKQVTGFKVPWSMK